MSNQELFNIFSYAIGISFLVALAIPIIGIVCSVCVFIIGLIPEPKLSIAQIDQMFAEDDFDPEYDEPVVPVPTNKSKKKNLNTNSPIREYRLPDGSMVAFDTGKVEVSEKSIVE